eukprot:3242624-Prymnesium_polylepis.1
MPGVSLESAAFCGAKDIVRPCVAEASGDACSPGRSVRLSSSCWSASKRRKPSACDFASCSIACDNRIEVFCKSASADRPPPPCIAAAIAPPCGPTAMFASSPCAATDMPAMPPCAAGVACSTVAPLLPPS